MIHRLTRLPASSLGRIRAELARLGRAGVPLIVVYSPDDPESPRQLSDLITVDGLLELLQAAAPLPTRGVAVTDVTWL